MLHTVSEPTITPGWLRLPDAARYCGVSSITLRRESLRGAVRAYRVGGRKLLLFKRVDLDEWVMAGATRPDLTAESSAANAGGVA